MTEDEIRKRLQEEAIKIAKYQIEAPSPPNDISEMFEEEPSLVTIVDVHVSAVMKDASFMADLKKNPRVNEVLYSWIQIIASELSRALARRSWSPKGRPLISAPEYSAKDMEKASCDAVSAFLAWHMTEDLWVKSFRQSIFGGTDKHLLLSEERAWECLTSYMWKILRWDRDFVHWKEFLNGEAHNLKEKEQQLFLGRVFSPTNTSFKIYLGVSPDKRAIWTSDDDQFDHPIYMFPFRSDDGTLRIKWRVTTSAGRLHISSSDPLPEEYFCVADTSEAAFFSDVSVQRKSVGWDVITPVPVPFFTALGITKYIDGFEGSLALHAVTAATELQNSYPVTLWDALRFLLTGIPPTCSPVVAQHIDYLQGIATTNDLTLQVMLQQHNPQFKYGFSARGPLSLLVQPWIQPEDLAEYWREARGATNRVLPRRDNIEIFEFVLNNSQSGKKISWQSLCDEWNKQKVTALSRGHMATAFKRVAEVLLPGFDTSLIFKRGTTEQLNSSD